MNNFDTIKFIDGDFEMDVNVSLENNDIWLTQSQLASLFGKSRPVITNQLLSLILENSQKVDTTTEIPNISARIPNISAEITDEKTHRKNKVYNLEIILKLGEKFKSDRGLKLKYLLNEYLDNRHEENNQIIIYNNGSLSLPVTISPEEDTVYLNQNQIAELFDTTQPNIAMHIKNIVEEGELTLEATHKYFLYVQPEGGRQIKRKIEHFNLDMILSIGYRVKSKNAIMFRRWVTEILKQYLLKGYVLNNDRISISVDNFVKLENNIKSLESRMTNIEENMFVKPVKEKYSLVDNILMHISSLIQFLN